MIIADSPCSETPEDTLSRPAICGLARAACRIGPASPRPAREDMAPAVAFPYLPSHILNPAAAAPEANEIVPRTLDVPPSVTPPATVGEVTAAPTAVTTAPAPEAVLTSFKKSPTCPRQLCAGRHSKISSVGSGRVLLVPPRPTLVGEPGKYSDKLI